MAAFDQLQNLPPALGAVVWLYLLTNGLRLVTYVPQVRAVWRDQHGAQTISLLTWGSWTVSNAFALVYAVLVAQDIALALISIVNLVGCGLVTGTAALRRYEWKRSPEKRPHIAAAERPLAGLPRS